MWLEIGQFVLDWVRLHCFLSMFNLIYKREQRYRNFWLKFLSIKFVFICQINKNKVNFQLYPINRIWTHEFRLKENTNKWKTESNITKKITYQMFTILIISVGINASAHYTDSFLTIPTVSFYHQPWLYLYEQVTLILEIQPFLSLATDFLALSDF